MTENINIPESLFKYGHFDENGYYKNIFLRMHFISLLQQNLMIRLIVEFFQTTK